MLAYKKIDLGLQILLAIATLFFLYQNSTRDWSNIDATPLLKRIDFSYFFLGLGALQVISAFVHYFLFKQFRKSRLRKIYHIGAVSAIVWLSIVLFFSSINIISIYLGIIMGVIMLIVSSLLAIFYMVICGKEIWNSKKIYEQ